jgi:hypothetical protein
VKLKIIQLNYGDGGGSATAYIYGPRPASALDRRPYLAIEIGYTVHSNIPDCDQATQEVVPLPGNVRAYARIGFLLERPVFSSMEQRWPPPSEYRPKVARMLANMIGTAELNSLDDAIPTMLPG